MRSPIFQSSPEDSIEGLYLGLLSTSLCMCVSPSTCGYWQSHSVTNVLSASACGWLLPVQFPLGSAVAEFSGSPCPKS